MSTPTAAPALSPERIREIAAQLIAAGDVMVGADVRCGELRSLCRQALDGMRDAQRLDWLDASKDRSEACSQMYRMGGSIRTVIDVLRAAHPSDTETSHAE